MELAESVRVLPNSVDEELRGTRAFTAALYWSFTRSAVIITTKDTR